MVHTYFVDEILETRATLRNSEGQKVWKILWGDGSITLEPLSSLIDTNSYLENIVPILQEYHNISSRSPFSYRLCLCCKHKTIPGKLFCSRKKCETMKTRTETLLK